MIIQQQNLTPSQKKQFREKIFEKPTLLGHYLGYKDLTEVHDEWIKYCYVTGPRICPFQAFRGSFKTTSITVLGIIWYQFFNPESRVLICRKEFTGAAATLWEIKQHYQEAKLRYLYSQLLGVDNPLDDSKTSADVLLLSRKKVITKEPSIMAMGVNGSATGWHFDLIVCDDIATKKDRYSKAERENTKNSFLELRRVVMPGSRIIVPGTPWHPDDVYSILESPKKYPIGSIDLPNVTPEWIAEERKGTTASLWAATMELKHIASEDRIFGDPTFFDWPDGFANIGVLDPAYDGDCNTSLVIGGIDKARKRIIIRGWTWRKSVVDLYPTIVKLLDDYKTGTLYVEKNADKGASARDLFALRKGNVQSYTEIQNKHWRIVQNLKKNWSSIDFASDCDSDFLSEVLEYTELDGPNDAPDAAAGLIRILLTARRPEPKVQYVSVG